MKLKTVQLKNFKRFTDLTINLGKDPSKIIALVGPNGCGKSSVFDAFEEKLKDYVSVNSAEGPEYYDKPLYSISQNSTLPSYHKKNSIFLTTDDLTNNFDKKSFYIRTAYRFTPRLKVNSIHVQVDSIEDQDRPSSSIALDQRGVKNYERLLAISWQGFEDGNKTGKEIKKEYIDKINKVLGNILDIEISKIGNVMDNEGQLFFEKEDSKNFPYNILSAGEKEVIDIVLDLILKTRDFNDTIYCIDEPELHLNTSIQRKLLIEIDKLIPDNCQLWLATHSIGFLRALQEDLKDKSSVIDFSEVVDFDKKQELKPSPRTHRDWRRIFQTALHDLTGLMAPKRIIYCEGGLQNSLDEKMFNIIFGKEFHETLFLSSGNKNSVKKYTAIALTVLNRAFQDVEIIALIDRDEEIETYKIENEVVLSRKLSRREFENYLFDKEILEKWCEKNGKSFDTDRYNQLIPCVKTSQVKDNIAQLMRKCCNYDVLIEKRDTNDIAKELAELIDENTNVYKELKQEIFGE